MKSVMMDGKVWFRFDPEEMRDLIYGLISAKVDNESYLDDYADQISISRQMQLRCEINRYQALIEQFHQGHAY